MPAKLYTICGNCGSDDLEYVRGELEKDSGDLSNLKCNDCSTLHFLKEINEEDGENEN